MKVSELITELQKYDGDLEVIGDWDIAVSTVGLVVTYDETDPMYGKTKMGGIVSRRVIIS